MTSNWFRSISVELLTMTGATLSLVVAPTLNNDSDL